MADNPQYQSGFVLKDALVVLPFFGSALAMCWEVGSFVPIGRGAFSLFSLSEHLLFALQALPLALAAAGWIAIVVATLRTLFKTFQSRRRRRLRASRMRFLIRFLIFCIWALVGIFAAIGLMTPSLAMMVLSVATLCLGFVMSVSLVAVVTWPPQIMLAGGCFALMFAMGLGFDATRSLLRAADRMTEIAIDGNTRKAIVIRAGERGLLVFDPSKNVFSFLKQDAFKSLDWTRPSFRPDVR